MKSAFAITWMFVAAGCAATPHPDVQAPQNDSLSAQAQLQYLKSLEGDWSGTGGPWTNGERIEVRYRVTIAGNAVVEEMWFPGTQESTETIYDVEGGKLCLTRHSTSGPPTRLEAEPDEPVIISTYRVNGLPPSPNLGPAGCEEENARATKAWLAQVDRQMKEGKFTMPKPTEHVDPSRHDLWFASPSNASNPDGWAGFSLEIHEPSGLSMIWACPNARDSFGRIVYKLTRKGAGVEKKADHGETAANAKPSWEKIKAYGDLRSDP